MTGLIGACDVGYSCAYMNTISWSTPTTPLPMEINPRVVFERLFGEGGTVPERLARMDEDKSILDQITRIRSALAKGPGREGSHAHERVSGEHPRDRAASANRGEERRVRK